MPLRVAFDLDGTVADMHAVLREHARRLFGEPAATQPEPPATVGSEQAVSDASKVVAQFKLTSRQQVRLWQHVRTVENFWAGLPEMEPGIVSRIAHAAAARRWEVIFLTTRPLVAGETTQIQTQRWLEAHGFPLPSVFVVQRSRGMVAQALELDAVVDDRPENCLDVAVDSSAKPILIWNGPPDSVPPGTQRLGVRMVPTISDALAVLVELDDHTRQPRVLRSLRKLFGKEAPV
jgi:hypothetical protein